MSTESGEKKPDKSEAKHDEAAGETVALATQGSVVAGMTLLSRISGLVRDIVLSYLFGASKEADIFFVALRVPNFFRRLFAEGAFNQAFVPVLMRYKAQGRAELLAFIAPLSGLFASVLTLVVIVGVVFAPALTALFAPGFISDAPVFDATAKLVRITFPYLGFISLTAYAAGLLNAHNRFAVPAVTPVFLNLCLIGAALLVLGGYTDTDGATTVAWGVLAAGVLQFLFQLPSLVGLGVLPRPSLRRDHPGVRQVGRLLVPAVFAASVGQINALVNTMLASTLITGSISWLYYADRLLELPVGLVAIALGTVMLPHLSRMAAAQDTEGFQATMSWGIGLGVMLGLPAAVALYVLAEPLIATMFMSVPNGAMTPYDVRMAGYALELFAVALPGFVLVKILAPAFFAHENTKSPFHYATGAVAANLVVSLATFWWFGHVGLAWATAISAWTHVLLLYHGLSRRGIYRIETRLWRSLWRSLLASGLLGLGLYVLLADVAWLSMAGGARALSVVGVSIVGGLAYMLMLLLLGVRPNDLKHFSQA